MFLFWNNIWQKFLLYLHVYSVAQNNSKDDTTSIDMIKPTFSETSSQHIKDEHLLMYIIHK